MQIEIKPNELDCPLRLCYECGSGERECKDCHPGVYELAPMEGFNALVDAARELLDMHARAGEFHFGFTRAARIAAALKMLNVIV